MTQSSGLRRLTPWLLAGLASLVGAAGPLFGWPGSKFDLFLAFTGKPLSPQNRSRVKQ